MITTKFNRNDPCPCGSGKKYKKCCGANETVSITSIIEKEVRDLQVQILEYAMTRYDVELESDFEEIIEELTMINDEETEFFMFIHSVWYTLFVPVDGTKTILQKFIEDRSKMVQRPKLKEILQTWIDPQPIAGRMVSFSEDQMVVKDAFTSKVQEIKLLDPIQPMNDSFIFGFVVPFNEGKVFFTAPFDIEGDEKQKEEEFLQDAFEVSGYENPQEFLKDAFLEVMSDIPFAGLEYSPEDFDWTNEKHKDAAVLYDREMQDAGVPNTNAMTGLILWYKFCEKQPVQKKKPATYAAALHFLVLTLNPILDVTKKEIAKRYDVSVSSLNTAIKEIERIAAAELAEIREVALEGMLEFLDSRMDDDEDWFFDDEDDDLFDEEDEIFDLVFDDVDDDDKRKS